MRFVVILAVGVYSLLCAMCCLGVLVVVGCSLLIAVCRLAFAVCCLSLVCCLLLFVGVVLRTACGL